MHNLYPLLPMLIIINKLQGPSSVTVDPVNPTLYQAPPPTYHEASQYIDVREPPQYNEILATPPRYNNDKLDALPKHQTAPPSYVLQATPPSNNETLTTPPQNDNDIPITSIITTHPQYEGVTTTPPPYSNSYTLTTPPRNETLPPVYDNEQMPHPHSSERHSNEHHSNEEHYSNEETLTLSQYSTVSSN